MDIQLEFYQSLNEKNKLDEVWEILCECDQEFIPSLSARESSFQNNLQLEGISNQEVIPKSYYKEMIKQHFILAVDQQNGKVVGFMTFKSDYQCEELNNYSPSVYITTICVTKEYRNKNITRKFYELVQSDQIIASVNMPNVTTRTWSSNHSHIHILETIGFEVSERLPDHRGVGIDTIYFGKRLT